MNENKTNSGALAGLSQKLGDYQYLAPLLGVLIVLLVGIGVWYWQKYNASTLTPGGYGYYFDGQQPPLPETPVLPEGSYYVPTTVENPDSSGAPKANTTVQWKSAAKLEDMGLIKGLQEGYDEVEYYYLGNRGANKIILAQVPAMDPGGPSIFLFEQTSKGYTFMSLMSSQYFYRGPNDPMGSGYYAISPLVTSSDTKSYYYGIVGPSKFTYNGSTLEQSYLRPLSMFELYRESAVKDLDTTVTKVATLKDGELYIFQSNTFVDETTPNQERFIARRYILKLPSGLYTNYNVTYGFFSDDRVPNITWADGTKNKDIYRPDAALSGCGSPGAFITSARDISGDVKIAGTTSTNNVIYEFKDIKDKTLAYFYQLQGGQHFSKETGQMESISISEWYKHHPVIAIKNSAGDYVLMTNEAYGLAAECGKPVIYLYPTQPTAVSVKVGADVTVSEPDYNQGWKVIAKPNGSLINSDGLSYDSLFWEGLGDGQYPSIRAGFVVAQKDLDKTITEHLKAQGLNAKESQDFKDFWMSRLPKTPYVRLTWFTTAQMDSLAPLYVTPKPDTVIRVFLDFAGMNEFASIPQQKLTAVPRQGFTLVEWGGLLKK